MKYKRMFKASRGKPEYRIENKASTGEATIYLYDEISWFGIQPGPFVKDLNSIDAKTIHLRINSPGGAVFDGMAIYNALKAHRARVIVHIDGLAASIASVIAMAADEIRIAENAFVMIHEAWGAFAGPAEELRKEAALLEKIEGTIAKVFEDRTGGDPDMIAAWMTEETWFSAEEALDAGLADEIDPNQSKQKNQTGVDVAFDLSAFRNVPKDLTDRYTNLMRRAASPSPPDRYTELMKRLGAASGL